MDLTKVDFRSAGDKPWHTELPGVYFRTCLGAVYWLDWRSTLELRDQRG